MGSPPQRLHVPPNEDKPDVRRLLWDNQGRLLALKANEAVEYDGVTWRTIACLKDRVLFDIEKVPDGQRIYVSGYKDIGYIEPDARNVYAYTDLRAQLPTELDHAVLFNQILLDREGRLYVSNLDLIHRFSDRHGPGRTWLAPEGVLAHVFVHDGWVYASTNAKGLFRIVGDESQAIAIQARNNAAVTANADLPDGRSVLALDDGRAILLNGLTTLPLPLEGEVTSKAEWFQGLTCLPNSWIAGSTNLGKLVVFDLRGRVQWVLAKELGLKIVTGAVPVVDPDGHLWIPSARGIQQIDILSPISVVDDRQGTGEFIERIALQDDRLWVTNPDGLRYSDRTKVAGACRFHSVPDIEYVESNLVPWQNDLIFSTSRFKGQRMQKSRLLQLDTQTLQCSEIGDGAEVLRLSSLDPRILYCVNATHLWRYRFEGDRWIMHGERYPTSYRIQDIVEAKDGSLWLTTGMDAVTRLHWLENGTPEFTRYGVDHGLPRDWISPRVVAGEAIFCTKIGIYRQTADGTRFEPHPGFSNLPADISAEFLQIEADERGNLWFASREGTGVLRRQPQGYAWDLLGLRMLGKPVINQILFEEPNVVWLSTMERVIRYDDRLSTRSRAAFATGILEIRSLTDGSILYGGVGPLPFEGLSLDARRHDLKITLTANAHTAAAQTQFSHRIDGLDQDWSAWNLERTIDLADLPSGDYTLRVRSRNVLGEAGAELTLPLRLLPPWHQTWWAFSLYGIGSLGVLAGATHLRSAYLKRRNLELQALVEERTAQVSHQAEELCRTNEELRETNEEMVNTNQQLTEANHRLEELNLEKNEFIGIVSHDLRNPLGAITQAAELLTEAPELSAESHEIVGLVQSAASTSLGIVTNLLDLNRIEQGRLVTALVACDLAAAAHRAAKDYLERATTKGIDIIVVAPDPVPATADPALLDQVLGNLVSNAVKYSPPGRRVWVTVEPKLGLVRCTVRDEGHGIRPEELGMLFKKFSRLSNKPTAGEQSVGLGLAIVRRMVEAMHGRIWCESIYGQGASFILELPTTGGKRTNA